MLDRAGRLTPGGLRAAIARAVMEVAPEKARKRREQAAKDARVQRWEEDSGNAALMGRELPPAEVLAADQRITAWARQLKKAGLDGSMDELRARAYLDILLDTDSRPSQDAADGQAAADGQDSGQDHRRRARGRPAPGRLARAGPGCGRPAGVVPAGFAGRINLTIPLATLLGLAERPGEIRGIGPIDPALARDLARAASGHPKTTWCVTVTDEQGHAIGHGCARPESASHPGARTNPTNPASQADPIRPAGPATPPGRDSPSQPPASTARRADTAPGSYTPEPADNEICS